MLELAAALEALLDELLVHVDEELGRRDVVVDENLPIGKRVGDARGARADREVMNQDVRRLALRDEVAIVARLIFEAGIGRLNEDVGLESRTAKHALDAEHFVADGVAVAEGREHLMDFRLVSIQHRSEWQLRQHVVGRPQVFAPFREPTRFGIHSRVDEPRASSSVNCARTSRYFCSMTGQA